MARASGRLDFPSQLAQVIDLLLPSHIIVYDFCCVLSILLFDAHASNTYIIIILGWGYSVKLVKW